MERADPRCGQPGEVPPEGVLEELEGVGSRGLKGARPAQPGLVRSEWWLFQFQQQYSIVKWFASELGPFVVLNYYPRTFVV